MPVTAHLVRWQKEQGEKDLQIVAVYLKSKKDTPDQVKALIKEKKMEFPVLFDAEGKNAAAFGVKALPVAYLLDATGVVVWEGIAVKSKTEAKPELEAAIKEQVRRVRDRRER